MRICTQQVRLAGWLGLFLGLLLSAPAWAQYTSATQDGSIDAANEYNNNVFVTRNGADTGGSWFISWNGTTLYLAKNGGNSAEPSFIYFDTDPVQPVTDAASLLGGNTKGSLTGTTNYNVSPQLPFRADARIFVINNYAEVRYRNSSGGWGDPITTITLAVSGNNRELAISWDALTGGNGRPASFNWLAYQSNNSSDNGNYRYDQAPGNPSSFASNNTTPSYEYYFTVLSTANGYYPTPAPANDRPTNVISFTGRRDISYGSFNSTGVWDFTYDSPGRSLSRTSNNSNTDWAIGGTLTVSAGTLTFGDASGSGATTTGNLLTTGAGVLSMNSTVKPLNVTGATATTGNNVTIANGGTLTLSSSIGGDLNLNGNFTLSNGSSVTSTFTPNNRAVTFLGSTIQTITGPATGTPLTFDFVTVNGSDASASVVQLASNIRVNQTLTFNRGNLTTINGSNAYILDLVGTGSLSGETETKNLTGFVTSTRTVDAGSSGGSVAFGNIGLTLTPTGSSAALGSTTVTRSRGVGNLRDRGNNQSINRNFRVTPTNTTGPFEETLRLDYFDSETPPANEGNLQLFYSTNVQTYPTSEAGAFTQLTLTTLSQSNNIATRTGVTDFSGTAGTVFTLGDQTAPLPVTLVSFTGRRAASAVRLSWQTGLEIDNAGFTIERQVAGAGTWQPVTFVPGTGSSQGKAYDYLDTNAPAGQLYYRLRQSDTSGKVAYSATVAIAAIASAELTLHLSPVPTPADQATLTVDLSTLPIVPRTLAIYDLQGRLLTQATAPAQVTTTELPVSTLAAGTYLVLVRTDNTSYRTRFIKL